ncbi:hypothetical protein ACVII0_000401 [Sinorhizobium meliloti]
MPPNGRRARSTACLTDSYTRPSGAQPCPAAGADRTPSILKENANIASHASPIGVRKCRMNEFRSLSFAERLSKQPGNSTGYRIQMEDRISVGPHEEELTVEAFNLDIARGFRPARRPAGKLFRPYLLGPIKMAGGAEGSLFAQLSHMSSAERKTMLVAGAAAAMTAIFGRNRVRPNYRSSRKQHDMGRDKDRPYRQGRNLAGCLVVRHVRGRPGTSPYSRGSVRSAIRPGSSG